MTPIERTSLGAPAKCSHFVGLKLGEFAPTRRYRGHGDKTEKGSRLR